MKDLLKTRWNAVCNDYLREFCKKHDIPFEDAYWPRQEVGDIVLLGEDGFSANMTEIRYDIDNDVPVGEFEKYFDYMLRVHTIELSQQEMEGGPHDFSMKHLNYENWCLGAPRYTEEQLKQYEETQEHIRQQIADFQKEIVETGKAMSHGEEGE